MGNGATNGLPLSGSDFDLLDALLEEEGVSVAEAVNVIPRRDPHAPVPLSYAQELVWLLESASPGLTAYKLPIARRLKGQLDPAALEAAFSALAARHEALRTRFELVAGEARQSIDPPGGVALELIDLRVVPAAERERQAAALLQARTLRPFDLANEHALRVTLLRLAGLEHVLLIETHHIVCDGWSLRVLFRELQTLYRVLAHGCDPVALAEPGIQCADYAVWERETLALRLPGLVEYWRGELGGALEPLALPTDFPRPTAPAFRGARAVLDLPPDFPARAKELARRYGATPYMLLLAAYAAVLYRYTGRAEILIGSGAAARAHAETENSIGYFTDMLVQRADLSGDPTFAELLVRVRESCLGAFEHRGMPLGELIAALRGGDRRLGHAALFEVVLTPQDTFPSHFALAGVAVEPYGIDFAATKFDLALLPAETENGLRLTVLYRRDLFAPATMQRFLGHMQSFLTAAIADSSERVSRLPLLDAEERALTRAANATAADVGPQTSVHGAIEAQALRMPDATAVACGETSLTYRELDARANRLAHRLRARGVVTGTPVGLLLERSVETVVALLGILKAGGYYVPLAPDSGAQRVAGGLAESGTSLVVSELELAARLGIEAANVVLLDAEPPANAAAVAAGGAAGPPTAAVPDSPAYALFTSGSSGRPKAVVVTHANLMHYARAIARTLGDVPCGVPGDGLAGVAGWRFGIAGALTADLGNTAVFPALCAGGTLDLIPAAVSSDPVRYAAYAAVRPLDVLKITPSHFGALLAGAGGSPAVLPRRWLVVGGEACSWAFVDTVRAAQRDTIRASCRLLNHYGPTEATVGSACFEVMDASRETAQAALAGTAPIGKPLTNVQLHVLDAQLQTVPIGLPGELYVSGPGVALGYVRRDDLTALRFIELPGYGRSYRTGDRVRRLTTGDVEFLGRVDSQVKIRGFRVEPGEVEALLASHPAVAQAAVGASLGSDGEPCLTAYVASKDQDPGLAATLRVFLAGRLPDYMLPASIQVLATMPLAPSGKIDRAALPAAPEVPAVAERRRPRTPTERALAQIWAEAFGRPEGSFGIADDFLALGGHSLLAIRILGNISRRFGVRLSLTTLFEAPTIEALTRAIDAEVAAPRPAAASIRAVSRAAYQVEVAAPATGSAGNAS